MHRHRSTTMHLEIVTHYWRIPLTINYRDVGKIWNAQLLFSTILIFYLYLNSCTATIFRD